MDPTAIHGPLRLRGAVLLAALLLASWPIPAFARDAAPPSVLLVTVDTLRADRLSVYGYELPTSPRFDELAAEGLLFEEARAVVPLTCPSLASMLTSLYPEEHGSTRNALRIRTELPSLPRALSQHGFATAGFVSNWALRDRLCGLAEHFDEWQEVLPRRRLIFGGREAEAEDVSAAALEWLAGHLEDKPGEPFFLWVHYVEPHFPYRLHGEYLGRLGMSAAAAAFSRPMRYDTEVAHVDHELGLLVEEVRRRVGQSEEVLTILSADHGESLGDHGYWGHGKHVYDNSLRVPLAVLWPGVLPTGRVEGPALLVDLPATVLSLLGLPGADLFGGFDWTPVMRGEADPPLDRVTYYQGHRGKADLDGDAVRQRVNGLLEVGRLERARKEVLVVGPDERRIFDLRRDPAELDSLVDVDTEPSRDLLLWLGRVEEQLASDEALPPLSLDEDDLEALRALGYVDE